MRRNRYRFYTYAAVLLLTFCALQPMEGQVPESQVKKEAEKILEADIVLRRIGLELAEQGENDRKVHTNNVLPGQALEEEVSIGDTLRPGFFREETRTEDLIQGKAPAEDALRGKSSVAERIPVKSSDELFELHAAGNRDLLGYCFASSARGRFENFEYFILYDTALVVQKVKVWKYRSSYGGAVAGKRWLRQFRGYRNGDLAYGRDVQAITGATISGNALVSEVVRAGEVIGETVAAMQ